MSVSTQQAYSEFPVSRGQRALWFTQQLAPTSPAYNIVHAVRFVTPLDLSTFQNAFQQLVDRHPALRTTFPAHNGEPVQRVHSHQEFGLHIEDASNWSESRLNRRLGEEVYRPFNLERGPLVRVAVFTRLSRECIVLLAMHHIITDLWSLALILHEVSVFYTAQKKEILPPLKPLRSNYTDYVRRQTEMLAGPEEKALWGYWRQQLAGELPILNLPTDHPRPPLPSHRGACQTIRLGAELTGKLRLLAKTHGTTLFTTLLTAFQVLLHRYTGQEDILIGTPKACRDRTAARLVGYFVNPVVVRAGLSGNPTFAAFLNQMHQTTSSAIEHGDYPFPLLVEKLQPARDTSRSPLFQAMFAWQKTTRLVNSGDMAALALSEQGQRMELGGVQFESMALEQWVSPFDMTLLMAEAGEDLVASFEYSTDLFEADTINRMLGHFQTLLAGITAHPEQPLAELPLLTEAERDQLLVEWNDTAADQPRDQNICRLFEAQVEQTPDAAAVVLDTEQLTYAQLNRQANRLARHLQQLGVGPGTPVGMYTERSVAAIVGLWGILKAGGVYLPLDPTYPPERLDFILNDARVKILLTQERFTEELSAYDIPIVTLDGADEVRESGPQSRENNLPPDTGTEDLAYIIYTSGSTGQPKGVMISHEAIGAHCYHIRNHFDLSSQDRVLQFASFNFDQSLEQILTTLISGATLVLRGPEVWPPNQFSEIVTVFGLTVINLPPAYWHQILQEWNQSPQSISGNQLRLVIIGGDAISPESLHLWQQLPIDPAVRLLNAYGPTETTITATTFEIPTDFAGDKIPIGQPLANRKAFILTPSGQPAPIGVPGELHLGGAGLAGGYLNRPELTAEKFIADPFSPEPQAQLYKTSDVARYLPDGAIEFLGRLDHQVKIRGFRIELGEIEAALAQHPAINEVIVVARQEGGDDGSISIAEKQLTAYLILMDEAAPTTSELRHFLQDKLPVYMVPTAFVILDSWPLTTSGKIDRRALPSPDGNRPALDRTYATPRTPLEIELAQMWADVLGIETIGLNDNFFDLGGHSLLATQLIARIRNVYQVELPLHRLFEAPTIANLATAITQNLAEQEQNEELTQLLTELDGLSAEEVQQLLAAESETA